MYARVHSDRLRSVNAVSDSSVFTFTSERQTPSFVRDNVRSVAPIVKYNSVGNDGTQHVRVYLLLYLHCDCALASGAVYCNRSYLCVCVFVAGGRAVSELYYSQRARSICVSLSAFFHLFLRNSVDIAAFIAMWPKSLHPVVNDTCVICNAVVTAMIRCRFDRCTTICRHTSRPK